MRIQTNTAANSALGFARANSVATERSIQRLSSGFRINRAADDAAGLAIANRLRADVRGLSQAQKNVAQGSAMLQVMDGAAQTISTILDRMKELATQANSANVGATDGPAALALQDEFAALRDEITRIAESTTYQGRTLLSGDAATLAFQVSSSGNYAEGESDMVSITTVNLTSGEDGLDIGDLVIGGEDAAAATALTAIDTAISTVASTLGTIGAAQSRMDFAATNVSTILQNTQAAESTIRDADMAYEMTQFTKNNILTQAAQSMLSQANQSAQSVLQLLRG
jgi:flagellin